MLNERMQGCFNIYEVDLMFKKVISLMDQRGDLYGERRSCKYYITTEAESTVLKVQLNSRAVTRAFTLVRYLSVLSSHSTFIPLGCI